MREEGDTHTASQTSPVNPGHQWGDRCLSQLDHPHTLRATIEIHATPVCPGGQLHLGLLGAPLHTRNGPFYGPHGRSEKEAVRQDTLAGGKLSIGSRFSNRTLKRTSGFLCSSENVCLLPKSMLGPVDIAQSHRDWVLVQ